MQKKYYLCAVKKYRSLSKSLTYRIMAVVLVMIAVITNFFQRHLNHNPLISAGFLLKKVIYFVKIIFSFIFVANIFER